jgi:hypothetical protein
MATFQNKDGHIATFFYLVFRIHAGELEVAGLFETRNDAARDLRAGFKIREIMCTGFALVNGELRRYERQA